MCIIHKSWAKRSEKRKKISSLQECVPCFCVFWNGQLYYACIIFPFSFYSYCFSPFPSTFKREKKTRIEGKNVGKFSYFSIEPKNIYFTLLLIFRFTLLLLLLLWRWWWWVMRMLMIINFKYTSANRMLWGSDGSTTCFRVCKF